MTAWNDRDRVTGPVDDAELAATDAFLDRLGRREPIAGDLDDTFSASLALLAGDVDLRQVPVDATHRALIAAGSWPLPEAWGIVGTGSLGTAHESWPPVPVPAGADVTPIVCPRTPPEESRPAGPSGSRGRRVADRRLGERRGGDRRVPAYAETGPTEGGWGWAAADGADGLSGTGVPRAFVLRVRSVVGLAAAAALVVVGGSMALLVTRDNPVNPLTGLTSVVEHWGRPGGDEATRAELAAKVELARALISQGRPEDAAKLLVVVQDHMDELDAGDRTDLASQVAQLQSQLATTPTFTVGPDGLATSTVATPGAVDTSPTTLDQRGSSDTYGVIAKTGSSSDPTGGGSSSETLWDSRGSGSSSGSIGVSAGSAAGSAAGTSAASGGSSSAASAPAPPPAHRSPPRRPTPSAASTADASSSAVTTDTATSTPTSTSTSTSTSSTVTADTADTATATATASSSDTPSRTGEGSSAPPGPGSSPLDVAPAQSVPSAAQAGAPSQAASGQVASGQVTSAKAAGASRKAPAGQPAKAPKQPPAKR